MNKDELIKAVAAKTETSQKQVSVVLSATIETITEAIAGGDKVTLIGFGTFESRDRKAKAREGRNPKTGEPMQIPAAVVPVFTAGKNLRETVNQ